jgi:hypothetical protein
MTPEPSSQTLEDSSSTAGATMRSGLLRVFLWVTIVAVLISLITAFEVGVRRGLRDSVGQETYGRVLFGAGAAITAMRHGGFGYSLSSVIETILTQGGLTADDTILARLGTKFPYNLRDTDLLNAALDKAVHFKWPFDPMHDLRGSGGDDIGLVDYARLGFMLFGYKIQSLYFIYFVILGLSVVIYIYTYRFRPSLLTLLAIACAAEAFVFSSSLFDPVHVASAMEPAAISVADPRFLSGLAIVPGLHLAALLLGNSHPSPSTILPAILQSIILIFAVWIRASAIWVILAIMALAIVLAISGTLHGRLKIFRMWPAAVLLIVWALHAFYVSIALHPVYREKGEISHHVFWHAVFYQLQFHPQWDKKYGQLFDNAHYDDLPLTAAKKYLSMHPPPHPEAIYLTEDRNYLKMSAAETYIRKAFVEFLRQDPKFVIESMFVYNPLGMYRVLRSYLSSLDGIPVFECIAFLIFVFLAGWLLSHDAIELQLLARITIFLTCAFIVSLLPILITVASVRAMGDQFTILLIGLASWAVLGLSTGIRASRKAANQRVSKASA